MLLFTIFGHTSCGAGSSWGGFSWSESFLLGAILSATDPVAVVGALHDLHAPPKLSLLISGEALLNDGSGVLLFLVFFELAKPALPGSDPEEFSFVTVLKQFLYLALGGLVMGVLFFLVTLTLLKRTNSLHVSLFAVFVGAYGCFFVAEHHAIEVSAVLAIVAFGYGGL